MNVSLTGELASFVKTKVSSGRTTSTSAARRKPERVAQLRYTRLARADLLEIRVRIVDGARELTSLAWPEE